MTRNSNSPNEELTRKRYLLDSIHFDGVGQIANIVQAEAIFDVEDGLAVGDESVGIDLPRMKKRNNQRKARHKGVINISRFNCCL